MPILGFRFCFSNYSFLNLKAIDYATGPVILGCARHPRLLQKRCQRSRSRRLDARAYAVAVTRFRTKETLNKLLCLPSALSRARPPLAYLRDMSALAPAGARWASDVQAIGHKNP
ncbi:MAG: hypothetical protein ACREU8_05490 [Gammaproteobacteria bacterium]